MDHAELIELLNTLVDTSCDGERGCRGCAGLARSAPLRGLLQRRADECRQAVRELQALVLQRGGDPAVCSADADAPRRGWLSPRCAASADGDGGDEAILDACERGEDLALRLYADAIANALPPPVHATVRRQLEAITRSHDRIRRLREQLITGA